LSKRAGALSARKLALRISFQDSRINVCISFSDLRIEDKIALINRHYAHITGFLDSDDKQFIGQTDILGWFTQNAPRYNNMRIMKIRLERAIFGKLSERILASKS
jgi:hypothetical protein